jgi:ElaB/YqjD/DUF883 family membrane-anchored ribosome-binding protein
MPNASDTGRQLVDEVKAIIADTEELLRAVGTESKEKIAGVRPRVEDAIRRARTHMAETEAAVEASARRAAREMDHYAHKNPWQTAGVAAGVGAAVGAIIGVLLARR